MSSDTSDVGSGLRERREAAGLSQLDVALRAPCSPAMVGLIDRGYRPHHSAVIARIDRVLSDAETDGSA
ncbi:MAG: helix-turn-helix transcriptional regulator [Solirubrobacteraceae bacterium]